MGLMLPCMVLPSAQRIEHKLSATAHAPLGAAQVADGAAAELGHLQLVPPAGQAGERTQFQLPPVPKTKAAAWAGLVAHSEAAKVAFPHDRSPRLKLQCDLFAKGMPTQQTGLGVLQPELESMSLADLRQLKRGLVAIHPRGWELARHEAAKDPKDGPRKAQQVDRTLAILSGAVFEGTSEGRAALGELTTRTNALKLPQQDWSLGEVLGHLGFLKSLQAGTAGVRSQLEGDPKALRRLEPLEARLRLICEATQPLEEQVELEFGGPREQLRQGTFDFSVLDNSPEDDAFMTLLFGLHTRPDRDAPLQAEQMGYMSTPLSVLREVFERVELGPDDVVADLGCGMGAVLQAAAHMKGCKGFGVEFDPAMSKAAQAALENTGLSDRVEIRTGDAGEADLTGASVVYLFNPFNGETLERSVDRILEAAKTRPIKVCTTGPVKNLERAGLRRTHTGHDFHSVTIYETDPALVQGTVRPLKSA